MPREFLKKYTPSPRKIRENKSLSFLGDSIHQPNLWHMNRNSVARAFAIGLFCTWLPIPLQTVLAAVLAMYYRAYLPISVALVFITNPLTIPPMFYFAYKLGGMVLGIEAQTVPMDLGWQWFSTTLGLIWKPLLFGCIMMGIISSAVGYFAIHSIWRNSVRRRWKDRKEARRVRKAMKEMNKEIKKELKKGKHANLMP